MTTNKQLGKLRTGDAFKLNGVTFIAFAVSPKPFDILCINTFTKKVEGIDEEEIVELIEHWFVMENFRPEGKPIRGKKLEELY